MQSEKDAYFLEIFAKQIGTTSRHEAFAQRFRTPSLPSLISNDPLIGVLCFGDGESLLSFCLDERRFMFVTFSSTYFISIQLFLILHGQKIRKNSAPCSQKQKIKDGTSKGIFLRVACKKRKRLHDSNAHSTTTIVDVKVTVLENQIKTNI